MPITLNHLPRRCQCGAIIIFYQGLTYNMPRSEYVLIFPERSVPRKTFSNCDYCVNHWGTDICACGSGEKYQVCLGGYDECGRPMQELPHIFRDILHPPKVTPPEPEPVIKPFRRRQRVQVRT